jgi:hypothetical protein
MRLILPNGAVPQPAPNAGSSGSQVPQNPSPTPVRLSVAQALHQVKLRLAVRSGRVDEQYVVALQVLNSWRSGGSLSEGDHWTALRALSVARLNAIADGWRLLWTYLP